MGWAGNVGGKKKRLRVVKMDVMLLMFLSCLLEKELRIYSKMI